MRTSGTTSRSEPALNFMPFIAPRVSTTGASDATLLSRPPDDSDMRGCCGVGGGRSRCTLSSRFVWTSVSLRMREKSMRFASAMAPPSSFWLTEYARNQKTAVVNNPPMMMAIGILSTFILAVLRGRSAAGGVRVRRNRVILDARQPHLVHHLGDDAGLGRLVGDDHDAVLRALDVEPLHPAAHVA